MKKPFVECPLKQKLYYSYKSTWQKEIVIAVIICHKDEIFALCPFRQKLYYSCKRTIEAIAVIMSHQK